jgi:hypothetical protein
MHRERPSGVINDSMFLLVPPWASYECAFFFLSSFYYYYYYYYYYVMGVTMCRHELK